MFFSNFWLYSGYVIQLFFIIISLYYIIISLFAFIPRRYILPETLTEHSFALIIAAHNEEAVISNLIESLKCQNYNKTKYEIFVIADNCTDNTAQVAREAGATVFERFDSTNRGKGAAMEWMFGQLFKLDHKFDFITIFDADNLADQNFLTEMNIKANQGNKAIQCYLGTKNPDDSWITYSYAIGYWEVNKLFQESRDNLQLSCQLSGTGFAIHIDLIKNIGWGATCLTEDMEYTAKLLTKDLRVAYAANAIIYDEKPITFEQSWNQRIRWMQGHADVASRFSWPLFKKAIQESNLQALDALLYLLQPLRIISSAFIYIMFFLTALYPNSHLLLWSNNQGIIFKFFAAFQTLWLPFALLVQNKLTKKTITFFPYYILYCMTWIPIAFIGIMTKNNKSWCHTKHVSSLKISDMENAIKCTVEK